MRGWWRTNRLWLPLVPVCVVAMAAASSYRVKEFWYDDGLHHRVAIARGGHSTSVTLGYQDPFGSTSRTFRVRLTGVTSRSDIPAQTSFDEATRPPAGTQVLVAKLDWAADPDQSLTACNVDLVDDWGRRYEPPAHLGDYDPIDFCVPRNHEGPGVPVSRHTPRGYVEEGEDRPPTWSTRVYFVVPAEVRADEVLLYWGKPDYVELAVP